MSLGNLNLINALMMLVVAVWMFISDGTGDKMLLLPVFFSVVLIVFSQGVTIGLRNHVNVATVVTAMAVMFLTFLYKNKLENSEHLGVIQVGLMMITNLLCLYYFFQFILKKRSF